MFSFSFYQMFLFCFRWVWCKASMFLFVLFQQTTTKKKLILNRHKSTYTPKHRWLRWHWNRSFHWNRFHSTPTFLSHFFLCFINKIFLKKKQEKNKNTVDLFVWFSVLANRFILSHIFMSVQSMELSPIHLAFTFTFDLIKTKTNNTRAFSLFGHNSLFMLVIHIWFELKRCIYVRRKNRRPFETPRKK